MLFLSSYLLRDYVDNLIKNGEHVEHLKYMHSLIQTFHIIVFLIIMTYSNGGGYWLSCITL